MIDSGSRILTRPWDEASQTLACCVCRSTEQMSDHDDGNGRARRAASGDEAVVTENSSGVGDLHAEAQAWVRTVVRQLTLRQAASLAALRDGQSGGRELRELRVEANEAEAIVADDSALIRSLVAARESAAEEQAKFDLQQRALKREQRRRVHVERAQERWRAALATFVVSLADLVGEGSDGRQEWISLARGIDQLDALATKAERLRRKLDSVAPAFRSARARVDDRASRLRAAHAKLQKAISETRARASELRTSAESLRGPLDDLRRDVQHERELLRREREEHDTAVDPDTNDDARRLADARTRWAELAAQLRKGQQRCAADKVACTQLRESLRSAATHALAVQQKLDRLRASEREAVRREEELGNSSDEAVEGKYANLSEQVELNKARAELEKTEREHRLLEERCLSLARASRHEKAMQLSQRRLRMTELREELSERRLQLQIARREHDALKRSVNHLVRAQETIRSRSGATLTS
jgi:chromosome segregation ATPase